MLAHDHGVLLARATCAKWITAESSPAELYQEKVSLLTDTQIFWAVVGGLVVSYTALHYLWIKPREQERNDEARALLAEGRQKREASIAEAKQRRIEEEIRLGQEEWRKKLEQLGNRLDRVSPDNVFRCTGRQFINLLGWQQLEAAVAFILAEEGWQTELTAPGPDRGIDIKCEKINEHGATESLVVQVKHFAHGSVGAPVVRNILGAALMERASKILVVTSAKFAKGVDEEFSGVVELWDGDMLSRRFDSLSDEQFERLAQSYKVALGQHVIIEREQLVQEQARLEKEQVTEQRLATIRENQLRILESMKNHNEAWPDCPRCGTLTAVRLGRTYFWGCTRYPTCRGTTNVPFQ